MISDYSVPSDCQPSGTAENARRPRYLRGRWYPEELTALAGRLDGPGREALAALPDADLLEAWNSAIATLLEPGSPARRALDPALNMTCRLSGPALQAALEAMLEGHTGEPASRVVERAGELEQRQRGLVVCVLPSNVPALAVQTLLPALALRRPVLLKSSSREPLLTAAMVHLLARRHPALAGSLAALTWHGGHAELEDAVFSAAETTVAYGSDETLATLGERSDNLVGHGTRASVGIVSADADPGSAAAGLAADIALFEQRGCLSIQAVLTDGDGEALARELAFELAELADAWPPPELSEGVISAVQLVRSEAELRGLTVADLPIRAGTVIVETHASLAELSGPRSVRVYQLGDLEECLDLLESWRGRLQGVALAGERAESLKRDLGGLGASRVVAAGELQRPDALWANGREHLLDRLA